MGDSSTLPAAEVRPGQRIRIRGTELLVTRVDRQFLGRDDMCCFVESTDERWACMPAPLTAEVEVLAG